MMHGLHPLGLNFVFVLSNHPTCGGEPKFYQGAGGYLGSIITRRHLWCIWTLAHITIFSKWIILMIERVHPVSSFPSRKAFALVSGSLFLNQVVGRVVSATISVSWHSQLSICCRNITHLHLSSWLLGWLPSFVPVNPFDDHMGYWLERFPEFRWSLRSLHLPVLQSMGGW